MRKSTLAVALLLAALAACGRDLPTGTHSQIAPAVVPPGGVLEIVPSRVTLKVGQTQQFDAFIMVPDFPPFAVDVDWSLTNPDIGMLSSTFGSSTVLTAALPPDASMAMGQVEAFTLQGLFAEADVVVTDGGEPIDQAEKVACVRLSKNGKKVGEEYCGQVGKFEIGFTPGKEFKVVYPGGETSAGPTRDGLLISIDLATCTIKEARWKMGTSAPDVITGAAGANELKLTVPMVDNKPTTDGTITSVLKGSSDTVYKGGQKPFNDAHFYFRKATSKDKL